jgi:hypothetical protein
MRSVVLSSAALVFAAAIGACEDRKKAGWTDIGIEELAKAMEDGTATVIDNNPKFVFEKRRLPDSRWLNAMKYTAADLPADKGAMVVFYCMDEN